MGLVIGSSERWDPPKTNANYRPVRIAHSETKSLRIRLFRRKYTQKTLYRDFRNWKTSCFHFSNFGTRPTVFRTGNKSIRPLLISFSGRPRNTFRYSFYEEMLN